MTGRALERAGKNNEALASYRKAVSVAEVSGDTNIESFRKNVARLVAAMKKPN